MEVEIWTRGEERVEAVLLTTENYEAVREWCGGVLVSTTDVFMQNVVYEINIPTLRGTARAMPGQYVVKDDTDNFWVIMPGNLLAKLNRSS